MEKQLANQEWIDAQDPEFIKALDGVKNVIQNMSRNMFLLLDYFQQYTEAIYSSPIFTDAGGAPAEPEDGKVNPTQTSAPAGAEPAPANRAERRAVKKSGLIVP